MTRAFPIISAMLVMASPVYAQRLDPTQGATEPLAIPGQPQNQQNMGPVTGLAVKPAQGVGLGTKGVGNQTTGYRNQVPGYGNGVRGLAAQKQGCNTYPPDPYNKACR